MRIKRKYTINRLLALLLALAFSLSGVNAGMLVSHAASDETRFAVGENVTATLHENGLLRLTGTGDTYDYTTDGEHAPFYERRAEIQQVEIDAGVTSIGACLFYNCGNLAGTLTIPSSVVSIGSYAFSGDSAANAPAFLYLCNEFEEAYITVEVKKNAPVVAPVAEPLAEPITEPVAEPVEEPIDEPVVEPIAEPVTEPIVEPLADPVAEPVTEPVTEPIAEPIAEPAAEPVVEPITEPIAEPITEPVTEPVVEPAAEPLAEPVAEPLAQPAAEAEPAASDGAVEQKDEKPVYTVVHIIEQTLGEEIFHPGQNGVVELASDDNASFFTEASDAGYALLISRAKLTFLDESGADATLSVPVTDYGAFLPDYAETALCWPDESHCTYAFTGWRIATDAEAQPAAEAGGVYPAHSFYTGAATSFTAVFTVTGRTLREQTIYADVGDQRVTISGNLPDGATVSAEPVSFTDAAARAGAHIQDAADIVTALDITILVDGVKYQPAEYGESVSVSITGIDAATAENESLALLHVTEDAAADTPSAAVEVVEVVELDAVSDTAVAFTADSFSLYIITVNTTYTLTFPAGDYTLTHADNAAIIDADAGTEGIQASVEGAIFKFKILPATDHIVTGVSVTKAAGAAADANLYGPDAGGIYTVSNVTSATGSQTVTIETARSITLTYDANGGTGEPHTVTIAAGQSVTLAWPADIGLAPAAGYHFTAWNPQSDGGGIAAAAGASVNSIDQNTTYYAQWSNAAAPFTAKLYSNSNYATSEYTELTEGGALGIGWNHEANPTRYLVIDVNFTNCNGGTISVALPTGMALYDNNYTKPGAPSNITDVEFVTLANQGTGTYSNPNTGTLTYTFSTATTNETLIIPVTFDRFVWDKSAGLANLSGDKAPITVTMTPTTGASSTKTLSKVLSSVGTGPNIYSNYWPKKVPIGDGRVCMSYSSVRNADTYWRTLTMEYILPHDTDGNYAKYLGESVFGETTLNGYALAYTTSGYSVDDSDPTKLVYTWADHKQSGYIYLSPVLRFPAVNESNQAMFTDGETLDFTVRLTGETYSGAKIASSFNCQTTATVPKSDVQIAQQSQGVYQMAYPNDVYNLLGGISLTNPGLVDSGALKVTYAFDTGNAAGSSSHNIEVAAFSLPQAKDATFDVTCEMVDKNNSSSFTHTLANCSKSTPNTLGYLLMASSVVSAYNTANPASQVAGDWYFKTVTYEIPGIPTGANNTLYSRTAQLAFADSVPSGGNYYGRILASATSKLTVQEKDATTGVWGASKSANANSNKTSTLTLPLYIGDVKLDGAAASKTITAGDSLTMAVSLRMFNYPYGTTQYSLNPVFYFVAPTGVILLADNVSAAWSDDPASKLTTVLSSRTLATGDTAYKIELNSAAFGGPTEAATLKGPDTTRYPILTLALNTAAGMNASNLLLKNNLFVTEAGGTVKVYEDYHTPDSHDLNNNGVTTELMGRLNNSNTTSITITPNINQLTFTAQAKMADEADASYRNGTGPENRLYLSEESDRVNYRLTLQNTSGSIVPAGHFMYYIPVPRVNSAMHTHMKLDGEAPGFDLALDGPVQITGDHPTLYDLRYSTDATPTTFDNGKADYEYEAGQATWRTAAEMTAAVAAGSVSWADVKMMKLVANDIGASSYIPTDTRDYFTLTLRHTGDNDSIHANAGKTSAWCCCGAQKYLETGELSNGTHTPTGYVTVMLRSEASEPITLTAAMRIISTVSFEAKSAFRCRWLTKQAPYDE